MHGGCNLFGNYTAWGMCQDTDCRLRKECMEEGEVREEQLSKARRILRELSQETRQLFDPDED